MPVVSVYQFHTILTASAGTVSVNITAGYKEGRQLIIIPETSSNQYDVVLTDRNGIEVYLFEDATGKWSDVIDYLVTVGNYTLTIRNASIDEDFEVLLTMRET
ncbi:MAG: hypothetical protein H6743_03695 [Rickettsiaceae bacterium]|nr:hypothetical protein [Rickettsiaceae bacterium]